VRRSLIPPILQSTPRILELHRVPFFDLNLLAVHQHPIAIVQPHLLSDRPATPSRFAWTSNPVPSAKKPRW